MKKLLLALALALWTLPASAQCNGSFSANSVCGTITGGPPKQVPITALPSAYVPSVSLSLPIPVFTLTNPTVSTSGGTLTAKFTNQTSSTFFAGPTSGASASTPSFRQILPSDLPTATTSAVGVVQPDGTTITITVSGVISGIPNIFNVSTKTSNYSVQVGDKGTFFNNSGAPTPIILSLPACTAGLSYGGFVATAQGLEFLANGTDGINMGAALTAPGGNIVSNLVGSKVNLWCEHTGQWSTLFAGTWMVN